MSALAPIGLGALRDATGDFDLTLWLLVVSSGAQLLISTTLTKDRLARGVRAGEGAT